MRRNYLLIVFVLGLMFFVSACESNTTTSGPFKGGTGGLEVSFVEFFPPEYFNQDETVEVRALLKNNGESNIGDGQAKVKLFGIDLPSFGLSGDYKSATGEVMGISEFIDEGGEEEVIMGNLKYMNEVNNQDEVTLKVKACYPYETKSQIKTCVSSVSIESSGGDSVCSKDGEKVTGGSVSSAPVQITSVTESFRGSNQIVFKIKVENNGDGEAYEVSKSCEDLEDNNIRRTSTGIIDVKVMPDDVDCTFLNGGGNTGTIRLTSEGIKEFTCTMNVEEQDSNKLQNLNIDLKYKYTSIGSTSFTIYEVV